VGVLMHGERLRDLPRLTAIVKEGAYFNHFI